MPEHTQGSFEFIDGEGDPVTLRRSDTWRQPDMSFTEFGAIIDELNAYIDTRHSDDERDESGFTKQYYGRFSNPDARISTDQADHDALVTQLLASGWALLEVTLTSDAATAMFKHCSAFTKNGASLRIYIRTDREV